MFSHTTYTHLHIHFTYTQTHINHLHTPLHTFTHSFHIHTDTHQHISIHHYTHSHTLSLSFSLSHTHTHTHTHRLLFLHNTIELDNPWVVELAHDGCLLKEPHPVLVGGASPQLFHSHFNLSTLRHPHSFVHIRKLTFAKKLTHPRHDEEEKLWLSLVRGGG